MRLCKGNKRLRKLFKAKFITGEVAPWFSCELRLKIEWQVLSRRPTEAGETPAWFLCRHMCPESLLIWCSRNFHKSQEVELLKSENCLRVKLLCSLDYFLDCWSSIKVWLRRFVRFFVGAWRDLDDIFFLWQDYPSCINAFKKRI